MKRHYLAVAVLTFTLGMTACSSGNKETTATPTTTAAQTEAEKSAGAEDDIELEYSYGFVGEVANKVVIIKDDADREVRFDVSETETEGADAIREGDGIEIAYAGGLSSNTTKVKSVNIVAPTMAETAEKTATEEGAIVTGIIEKADDNTLTLATDEGTYTFNAEITQRVSGDSVKSGVQADVTYYGDLGDDTDKPMVTKIIAEDTMDSEGVKINTLSGKVAEVGTDHVVIDTVDPEDILFALLGEEGMFDKLKIGGTTTIIYKGALTDKTITTTGVK